MLRSAPRMLALLMTATALAGCSVAGMMGDLAGASDRDVVAKPKAPSPQSFASDLDGNLRQAKLLREAGKYDEAIHILSQLMLAAADDPRVSAEYGKALAQKGRSDVAVQFLTRAIQLAPNDWTLYSAMGVSYDQLGDAANAKMAYDHALALKPGDAGVLNNYALSRMLAKDPEGAQLLIAQAQAATGGKPDEKIARNVELINGMAPKAADLAKDVAKPTAVASARKLPAPQIVAPPAPRVAAAAPVPAPQLPPIPVVPMPAPQPAVASNDAPQSAGDVARLLASQNPVPAASGAPRQLAPQMAANQPRFEAQPISQAPAGVVMQAVPYDPFAGPVLTLKKPQPKKVLAKAEPQKGDKPAEAKPTRTAAKVDVVPSLRVAVDKY